MLHTNKAVAIQKEKRATVSQKQKNAIETGDIQGVIDSLSEKQRRFCEEFLVDMNATKAVQRAGYATNPENARKIGYQLRENPAVRIAIDALRAERSKNTDVTKDFVLSKIVRTMQKAEEDNQHQAVLRGAELLAKHLGMFVERQEISGPDGAAIAVQQKVEEDAKAFTDNILSLVRKSK